MMVEMSHKELIFITSLHSAYPEMARLSKKIMSTENDYVSIGKLCALIDELLPEYERQKKQGEKYG